MSKTINLNERTRAALQNRLGAVPTNDVPTYRRVARLYDALKLDELGNDVQSRLGDPRASWNPEQKPYELTSAHRDDLIAWLEPTERAPLSAFMGRLLMPVYDELKTSRDGQAVEAIPE